MSRIGKKEIVLPKGVDVTIQGQHVKIKGPKGSLERDVHRVVTVAKKENKLVVTPKEEDKRASSFQGLTRTLINNMVVGVTEGFTRSLTLVGVGYRGAIKGDELQLTLGYSHPVNYKIPKGLDIKVDKLTTIVVTGCDKELVGQSAANIRSFRKPEPYHGKGVRYSDEVIVTKVGKAAGKK